MQVKRRVSREVIKEISAINKEREAEQRKDAYLRGCHKNKIAICEIFYSSGQYTPNCIDYDKGNCPVLKKNKEEDFER